MSPELIGLVKLTNLPGCSPVETGGRVLLHKATELSLIDHREFLMRTETV